MKSSCLLFRVFLLASVPTGALAFVNQVHSPLNSLKVGSSSSSSSSLNSLPLESVCQSSTDLFSLADSFHTLSHSSSFLVAAEVAKVATKKPDEVSIKAIVGAATIMGSIVGLLFAWDKAIIYFRSQVPVSLKPTVESIFSTLSGLGVIGVGLYAVLGIPAVQKSLEAISKEYFGKKDILVTNFAFFHQAYLQLGVIFFLSVVAMILKGLQKLNDIDEIQDAIVDGQTGYRVTAEKLVGYYSTREFNRPQEQPGYTGISRELFMERSEWSAKILMLRNLVMYLVPSLPADFRVEALIEESFAQNMYKFTEVPYLAWAFIIPALAITNAIDLTQGVVNSGSSNAAASAGEFIDAFIIFTPMISALVISSIWSYWNCWKMTQIKYMILPKLEPDPINGGEPVIRAPPIYSDYLRQTFNSSPRTLQRVEAIWGKPPRTAYDELFGEAGAAGLEMYRNSIKYQAWLNLATITYFGVHILPRDIELLTGMAGAKAGEPTLVSVELFTYGIFFLISLFQLTYVTPRTFWNFCIISCMEDENLQYLLNVAGYGTGPGIRPISPLRTRQGGLLPTSGSGIGRAPIRKDSYSRGTLGGGSIGGMALDDDGSRMGRQGQGGGGPLRLEGSRPGRLGDGSYRDDYMGQDNYQSFN